MMIWLADKVSAFLQKNRKYEVLGLFMLFVVEIMLVSEGGHLAHLRLFGHEIMPMTKATFYFVIFVLVITDVVQGRYQKKLLAQHDKSSAITARQLSVKMKIFGKTLNYLAMAVTIVRCPCIQR